MGVYFVNSIMSATLFLGLRIGNFYPAAYAFNVFLFALLCLHIFWFILIVRVAMEKIRAGHVCALTPPSTPSILSVDSFSSASPSLISPFSFGSVGFFCSSSLTCARHFSFFVYRVFFVIFNCVLDIISKL